MWPNVLNVLTVIVLMLMFYDDLKHRSIRVFLFPLLLLVVTVMTLQVDSVGSMLMNAALNIAFLVFVLLISYLILLWWQGSKVSPVKNYLGAGDILFLLCISVWFEPAAFVLFNTVSFLVALAMHQLMKCLTRYEGATVPLAGFQGLCFAILILSGLDLNSMMRW